MEDPNELNVELLSMVGLNPWVGNNSGAREYMFTSHIGQRLIVDGATEKRVQTGMEIEFAKYTFAARMPVTGQVIKLIQKYTPNMTTGSYIENTKIAVIYEELDSKRINILEIPAYKSFHQTFGYRLVEKPIMSQLSPGMVIPKDTVLADSPSVSEVGGYKYGTELNVAFMSHPAVAEDGMMISEEAIKKLTYTKIETRVIEFGESKFPINLYGDDENYKGFPDIGDYIRDDGMICCLREHGIDLGPACMSKENLKKPMYFSSDEKIYSGGGKSKVIDINVTYNKAANGIIPSGCERQIEKYINASRPYYSNLIATEAEIRKNRKIKHGVDKIDIGPDLHRVLYDAHVMLDPGGDSASTVINKLYRRSALDMYKIEITLETKVVPTLGLKVTDSHGGKGVICRVVKASEMPVDKNGVVADIVADDISTLKRSNLGRIYEHYVGSVCMEVKFRIRDYFGLDRFSKYEHHWVDGYIRDKDWHGAFDILLTLYKISNERTAIHFSTLTDEEKIEHISYVVVNGPYLFIPPDTQKPHLQMVREFEETFKPLYDKVSVMGPNNQRQWTKSKVRIAPMYILTLEKIADAWSSLSSGKLNHFGVLAPINKTEKYTSPIKKSPVKVLSESDGRIYASYTTDKCVAEVTDRNNNPITHREIVKSILNAEKPGYIVEAVDRNKVPYGGSRPLQMVNHMLLCYGFKLKHFDSNKE